MRINILRITCCVDFFTKIDEYGDIKFEDVKARVDNFLFQINALSDRGTIEVVGPSRKVRAQLMKRAARAKDYGWRFRSNSLHASFGLPYRKISHDLSSS